jgi:hypothetical protein
MVVEKSVLMNVVFPKPDSPATYIIVGKVPFPIVYSTPYQRRTIIVKAAPRFATIL